MVVSAGTIRRLFANKNFACNSFFAYDQFSIMKKWYWNQGIGRKLQRKRLMLEEDTCKKILFVNLLQNLNHSALMREHLANQANKLTQPLETFCWRSHFTGVNFRCTYRMEVAMLKNIDL